MIKVQHNSLLILLLFSFFSILIYYGEIEAASPDLPGTQITVPWNDFNSLVNRKVDTLIITPQIKAPVSLVFEKIDISINLQDSIANTDYILTYRNVSDAEWSTKLLLQKNIIQTFSGIKSTAGDYVQISDSGYILLSQRSKNEKPRVLKCNWIQNAELSRGVKFIDFAIPDVIQGQISITAPKEFENVSVEDALLISKINRGNNIIYRYTLPTKRSNLRVNYTPPVKEADDDQDVVVISKDKKDSRITVFQEGAIFSSKSSTFLLNNIKLNVLNSPITSVKIEMPKNYTLLKVKGNGINNWKIIDSSYIEINFTFELEGNYSLLFVGEVKNQYSLVVPSFGVVKATRQSGIFAIAVEGNGEGSYEKMVNCIALPLPEFSKKLSQNMRNEIRKYNKDPEGFTIAGINYKYPFSATYSVKHHTYFNVADAIADSGTIISMLSDDGKVLTNVSYYLQQRSKQFLQFELPDSCDLWEIKINGKDVAPFIGDDGTLRLSLQRYTSNDVQNLIVNLTYFKKILSFKKMKSMKMIAPVPDIPINSLNWSVYYPENMKVLRSGGDFKTSKLSFLGKRKLKLGKDIQTIQYKKIKTYNQSSGGARNNYISNMSDSPDYIFAKTILVENEKPELIVEFISKSLFNLVLIVSILLIAGVFVIILFVIVKKFRHHNQ